MTLSAIVAVDENNAIGRDNHLPWYLPEDLKYFKRTTMGKPVLMGRKTYDSLGKHLPGRLNIVVSSQKDLQLPEGVLLYNSLGEAIERLKQEDVAEGFIIGGGKIFEETIGTLDRLYITLVHTKVEGAEVYFPHVDHTQWKLVADDKHQADEKNAFAYDFQVWERVSQV